MAENKQEEKQEEKRPEDIISAVKDRKTSVKSTRSPFERQWLVNIAMLFGKQYFDLQKTGFGNLQERIFWEFKDRVRNKQTRKVVNYILPLYRSLLSRMIRMKANVNVEPTTRQEADKAAARVGREVLEDFWQMCNKHNPLLVNEGLTGMLQVLLKLFSYLLTIGTGYLFPYFNPKANSITSLAGKQAENEVGEVEVVVRHPFQVFEDPMRTWVIDQEVRKIDFIKENYGKNVKPADVGMTEEEKQIITLLEGSTEEKYKDAVLIYRMWEIPGIKYPHGRFVVCTDNEVLEDTDIPSEYKNRIPLFRFNYLDLIMTPFAQSMVEQLIPCQEDLNYTVSRLAAYKKWMSGKILVPDGSNLRSKYTDEIGQMIIYDRSAGAAPKFDMPPSPPQFLMLEVNRNMRFMEDLAAAHDPALGKKPAGITSGIAIENLNEMDNAQLAPILIGIEEKLSFFAETVLDIAQAKYAEKRLLRISGEEYEAEVKEFTGSDLKGNRRIRIRLGSSLPLNREARQQYIDRMVDKGYISREKGKDLMEFGDIEGVFASVDENQAKMENMEMLKGSAFYVALPVDDHTIHLKTHGDLMKTKAFRKLRDSVPDETKKKGIINSHYQAHQDFILSEKEAAKKVSNVEMPAAGSSPNALTG